MLYFSKDLFLLKNVIDKLKTKSFSIETQYKFLKLNKIVEEELDIYEEQKNLLIQNFGQKDEEGKFIIENGGLKIKAEDVEACEKRAAELNAMKISFPDIYFSLNELDSLGLTLEDLACLEPFIKN